MSEQDGQVAPKNTPEGVTPILSNSVTSSEPMTSDSISSDQIELEVLYMAAPIGLCFVDAGLRFVRINQQLADINGLAIAEHIGRTLRDVLPEQADQLEPLYRQVIESGKPLLNLEFHGVNQAQPGVERDWVISLSPLQHTDGRIVGVNAMVQEVTTQKRLERDLHEANQRILTNWESMTDAYITLDREWRITYANPAGIQAIYNLTTLEPSDFLGKSHWEVFPWSVGQDVEQHYRRAMSEQIAVRFEVLYEPTNNWFETHVYPSPVGLNIYFRDVSDRRRAELLLVEQKKLLELTASGCPLEDCLTALCTAISKLNSRSRACILLADPQRLIFSRSITPGFPPSFGQGLKDAPIHKLAMGTCGTAVYGGEPVTSVDIANDDRWEPEWRDLYIAHEVLACHSALVWGVDNVPLGSLMLCFATARAPTEWERQLVDFGTQIASIVFERERSILALRESQERLSLAIDSAGMATWDMDMQTGRGIWSESYFRLLGYEPVATGEATHEMWLSRVHPDDLGFVMQALDQAQQTGIQDPDQRSLYSPEYRIIRADTGKVRWLKAFGRFIEDQTKQTERFVGVVFDTSDRKQSEAALQQREAELRLVTNAVPALISFVDADQRYRFNNQGYEEWFGQSATEVYGKPIREVLGEAAYERVRPYVEQVLTGQTVTFESQVPHRDGGTRYVNVTYVPQFNHHGTVEGFVALVNDVSDRKQAALNDQFLNQLDIRLRQLSTVDEMLWETMSQLGSYLNVDRSVWHGVDLTEGLVIVEQDWRRQEIPSVTGVHQLSDFVMPDLVAQYQAGQTVVVSNVTTDPNTAPLAEQYLAFHTHAFVSVPCISEGCWVANLVISAATVRQWRSDEVVLLQEIVARLWSLIEHTRAVQDLRQSEAKFRQLANAMPQIVWVSQADGSLEFINDRWIECSGLTLEQSRDRTLMEQLIPPEDSQQLYKDFARAQETRSPYESQFRLIQPDGSYLHFLTRATPILNEQGQIRKWYGTSTDITKLKQLEEELRQKNAILNVINEAAPTPIFMKDRQGRIIFANPATLEVLGKSADEVIGYRDCDLYPSLGDAAGVMENDQRIMESGQMEVVEESPDGIRTFLGMKVPYRNEAGEVIGLIGISNDITNRVELERDRERILQQEQAAREAAENANRIKDEFLAVLSHELRSPLNPILGWVKLLQSRKFDEARMAEALATIERNAKLQAQLVEDLLDISRIMSGKLTLNAAPVSLTFVISAALETVRLAAEAKSIHLIPRLDTTVDQIFGDAGRLQQAVWNLLSNAVKFTPTGGRVEVRLNQVKDELDNGDGKTGDNALSPMTSYAQIQVIDTGKGINPEFLPYVFEYFRQEDASTTRRFGGLGLGLAIARQIVEMHGGKIWVESQGDDQGATFTVQIPLLKQTTIHPQSALPQPTFANNQTLLAGIHILMVDDDPDTRELLAFLLEESGAIVRVAASAPEALEHLKQTTPNILLSDIGMPGMDGYALIKTVRSHFTSQTLPAIALTAYAAETDQQQAIAAGFQRHIAKPIEPLTVIRLIQELVQS